MTRIKASNLELENFDCLIEEQPFVFEPPMSRVASAHTVYSRLFETISEVRRIEGGFDTGELWISRPKGTPTAHM